ncbi:MAG TPA: DUF3006 domain-containing protein [Gemmatimonadaceae bacterium]|nr:DUF3006 domain-containing protein [Gemmatimonadaceae bacterium]
MAGERDTKRAGGAASAPAHRWAVDRIEEGTAAVEQDGDHVYEIPRYLVPPDTRDGDVLSVTSTSAAPGEVTITVRIDRTASAPPPVAKPRRKPRRSGTDAGGDIVL